MTTLGMLIGYDADGNVLATLNSLVRYDENGNALGLVDFAAHEEAGGEMTDVWKVEGAKGSKVWPEWIGGGAGDFRVELVGPPGHKRIDALVHKVSGHRRERQAVEAGIALTPVVDGAKDIRRLVGGPDRPLRLNADGTTSERPKAKPSRLPVVAVRE